MLDVNLVDSLLRGPVVHNVGDEVVGAPVGVLLLDLGREELGELDALDGEVDDGGVLLEVEGVLRESLEVEDDVGRQLGDLELLQEVVLVRLVLLLRLAVELGQDVEQRNLKSAI